MNIEYLQLCHGAKPRLPLVDSNLGEQEFRPRQLGALCIPHQTYAIDRRGLVAQLQMRESPHQNLQRRDSL